VFFGADSRSFFDHLSPAFHHDFTIKKPSRVTTFPQKPLLKWLSATFKKSCRQHAAALPQIPPGAGTTRFLIPPQNADPHANPNAAVRLPDTRHFAVEMHIEEIAAAMRQHLENHRPKRSRIRPSMESPVRPPEQRTSYPSPALVFVIVGVIVAAFVMFLVLGPH
jgi:hypothetical protein